MKRQFSLLYLLFSALISGCMPLVHNYYSPNAEEGIVKKSTCHESSGPPDTIEFTRNDVIIKIRASEVESGVHVFVRLSIPKGKSVRLERPTVKISSPSVTIAAEGTFSVESHIAEPPWDIKLETNEAMIGDTKESNISVSGPKTYDSYFTMSATVTMPKSEIIKVNMPILNINDVKVTLPEILFKMDRFLELFAPINC